MKGEYLKLDTVKTMAELLNENKELRERIDKAIEYIEHNDYFYEKGFDTITGIFKGYSVPIEVTKLIEILKEENFDIKKEKEFEYMEEYLIQKSIEGEEE